MMHLLSAFPDENQLILRHLKDDCIEGLQPGTGRYRFSIFLNNPLSRRQRPALVKIDACRFRAISPAWK